MIAPPPPPPEHPGWWIFAVIRRVTVFLLGTFVVIAALIDPESANTISMLVIGMVMVGILPLDTLFSWHIERRAPPDDPSPTAGGTPRRDRPER